LAIFNQLPGHNKLVDVQSIPFLHKEPCPSREAPLNDLPGLYQEFGLMLAISRMEVRRRMVSVVHGDDNTEETG